MDDMAELFELYRGDFDVAPSVEDRLRDLVDIEITNDLGFVRVEEGAVLQFLSPRLEALDLFSVGVSWKSLRECRAAIEAESVNWRMMDGSLRVTGNRRELNLTFVAQEGSRLTRSITLTGESLDAFRSALEELVK